MKNNPALHFAVWLIAAYVMIGAEVKAHLLPNNVVAVKTKNSADLQNEPSVQDDLEDPQCESFPKDTVFDNLQQALQAPEKVRCFTSSADVETVKTKHLPPGLGKLINLEVLSLGCLESLEALPEEIGNLRKLRALIIDNGNGCSMNVSLPRSIGKLENLRVLKLYGALDPRDIDTQNTRRLKSKPLPDTIGNLRRLEILDLGRNGLKAVPPQIASLTQLKILRLDYNDLRELPSFVGNFKRLRELSLDSNSLTKLPAPLTNAQGLKVFMGNNSLKLRDQKILRSRFPKIVFSFENEYDDSAANEEPRKPKVQPKRRQ